MRDQTGYLGLERLGGAPPDDRHAWVLIQRAVYGRFLDGLDPLPLPKLPRLSPEAEAETAKVLREAGDVCLLLTRQGQVLLRDPVPALKTKFLAYWQRLVGLLREDRRLSPLGRLLTARGEECGGDLASFLEVVVHHQRAVEAFSRAVGLAPAEA
jgi:hypothetical protein